MHEDDAKMMTGTVKFFNKERGFGFITPDNGIKDVFFHVSTLFKCNVTHIEEGDKVIYDTAIDITGRMAVSDIDIL